MYRPQFLYSTPPGCRDEEFTYYFDGSSVPLLNQSVSNVKIPNIPLLLQQDAPFYWRGYKVALVPTEHTGFGAPVSSVILPNINVRFQDCYQNDLQDDYVPVTQFCSGMNPFFYFGSQALSAPTPLDPEIYCPPGGYILFSLQSATISGNVSPRLGVLLYGIKRFKECS